MNGEMVAELRAMAASDRINDDTCMRLMLASQADVIEQVSSVERKVAEHKHDNYALKDHKHPLEYLTAGLTALIAAAFAALKP
jgi:hypothetical protein